MPILQSSDSHPLHSRPNRELSTRIRKNLGHVCASTQAAGKIAAYVKMNNSSKMRSLKNIRVRPVQVIFCVFILLGAVALSGCGTMIAHSDAADMKGVYTGLRFDAEMIPASTHKSQYYPAMPWIIPFCIVDIPLSTTLDTVILPYDLRHNAPNLKPTNQVTNTIDISIRKI